MAEQNDIGFAVEAQNLTDEDWIKYLNSWTPNNNNEFPQSHHIKNNKERARRLLPNHLTTFPWLAVSKVEGRCGAFCVPCVLFMTTLPFVLEALEQMKTWYKNSFYTS